MARRNMKSMTGKEVIRVLKREGWEEVRWHKGDHLILQKGKWRLSIPYQNSTLSKSLHNDIWDAQSAIMEEEV